MVLSARRRFVLIAAPVALLVIGAGLLAVRPRQHEFRIGELERAAAGLPSPAANTAQPASFAPIAEKAAP